MLHLTPTVGWLEKSCKNKRGVFSDDFGSRNPTIQKPFQTKSDTISVVARVSTRNASIYHVYPVSRTTSEGRAERSKGGGGEGNFQQL